MSFKSFATPGPMNPRLAFRLGQASGKVSVWPGCSIPCNLRKQKGFLCTFTNNGAN
ncbi:hypothetical protein DPMN_122366 [Dreissena polymorpha]|uniref:Uncharacterized protein n=1 Tax=Dreissena polymorpha TaxID=45954 RepID=A0A9D4GSC7_DREPO|nr:hypothetical protein DPMN_122366 [Dreissena polymorpha]